MNVVKTLQPRRLWSWLVPSQWKRKLRVGAAYSAIGGMIVGPMPPAALGADYTWTGGANNSWTDANNWAPIGTPGTGDTAGFGPVGLGTLTSSGLQQLKI